MAQRTFTSCRNFQTILNGEKISITSGQEVVFKKKSIIVNKRTYPLSDEEKNDFKFLMD